jgi:hypothetical protein
VKQSVAADVVKDLIDNFILVIKINASTVTVQDIQDHSAQCTAMPEIWHSKNYAFESVECINSVTEKQLLDELPKSRFHMFIVDKNTAFYCSQYL